MTIFYQDERIMIRSMVPEDARNFFDTFLAYGKKVEQAVYEAYFRDQEANKKWVFVAEYQHDPAGLCCLNPCSLKGPAAIQGIPEIEQLTVFDRYRHLGIGTRLLEVAEKKAGDLAGRVSLSVGLHTDYGRAQVMYAQRGYIPDGSGVWYRGRRLAFDQECRNDDDLVLYLLKELPVSPAEEKTDTGGGKLWGRVEDESVGVAYEEILYLETVDERVFAYTMDKVLKIDGSLNSFMSQVNNDSFFRCSKSMVININRVSSLKSLSSNRIDALMESGEHIIISRRYASEFRKLLRGYR